MIWKVRLYRVLIVVDFTLSVLIFLTGSLSSIVVFDYKRFGWKTWNFDSLLDLKSYSTSFTVVANACSLSFLLIGLGREKLSWRIAVDRGINENHRWEIFWSGLASSPFTDHVAAGNERVWGTLVLCRGPVVGVGGMQKLVILVAGTRNARNALDSECSVLGMLWTRKGPGSDWTSALACSRTRLAITHSNAPHTRMQTEGNKQKRKGS